MKKKIVMSNYVILSTDIQFVIMYLLEKIYINRISSFLSHFKFYGSSLFLIQIEKMWKY